MATGDEALLTKISLAKVTEMSWREWLGLAAGLLALVALFFPWTVLASGNPEVQAALAELPGGDVTRSAWNSTFFAWFPPLLVLLMGLVVGVFGRVPSARTAGLPHLWLIAAVVAVVSLVLGWVLIDWQFGEDVRGVLDAGGVTVGAGVGRYLALVAGAGSLVAAVFDLLAARAEFRAPRKPPRTSPRRP
ncbi:hypothetical protein SAMN05421630_102265 [Prauserella marina]|uniref:Uncharacterized protein n=1 Tax=Prauserella marina TaxID=530584 RepID=A0A1G6LZ87_9PSEU|nr:hypothetical protein DES30_1011727 [Prauserella marina]SDC48035.1 hypothetical protein SAMN05421630_102265 [Prauserella marina]